MNNSNYQIVALNNKPRLINLDNNILREDDASKLREIAYIDHITARYSEEVFRHFLLKKGYISEIDTPIYLAKEHMYKGQKMLKYFDLAFKSKYNTLLNNVALTTIRNRNLTFSDVYGILELFEKKYFNDNEYKELIDLYVNEHTINQIVRLLNGKDGKIPTYLDCRNIISCMIQIDKEKSFENYMLNNYKRDDYKEEVLKIMPKIGYEKVVGVEELTLEEIEKLKKTPWDNKEAHEIYQNGSLVHPKYLNLEDKLRAGIITSVEYRDMVSQSKKR